MAWTAPRFWVTGEMATAALLNTHIRDNLLSLGSDHAHGGAAGGGTQALGPITQVNFADQGANPAVNGRLQRNAANLVYYNGTVARILTNEDPAAATPGLRSLGAGATQAVAGNHSH